MWKKVAQALGAVHEESEQILETEGVDRHSLEIVSVKGTTETICHLVGWVSITSQVNGRNENSQTKRLPPHENCYFDNNNWWIYTEQLSIPRDGQIFVEFQVQFEAGDFTIGSTSISWSALTEEVCEFDLTPHETSLAVKTKISNLKVSLRVDPTVASLSSGAPPTPPLPSQPTAPADDFPKVGVARVTTWQGKNLTSSYPVYLETTTNLMSSRRFRSQTVINPHNPIFDHVSVFDLTSLQGDIFLIVREKHAVRANRVIGQVVIPFSWVVDRFSLKLKSPNRSKATLSGWFELFPFCKPSRLNRGGQYRPFVAGIPQYAGYGVIKPEKSLGFLRIEIEFSLLRPLLYTMMAHPFCHSPHLSNLDYEDENPLAGMYVAKNNFKRIMKVWRLPLLVKTVSDIIHWRTHWSISAFVLYLHAYTFLVAPVWQFPLLIMFLALFIGVLAARRRTYDDTQLFVSEEALAAPQESADEPKDSKSLAEKYKNLKNGVKSMEMSIDGLASLLEHVNNLLLMSDPILSAVAFAFAFFVASLASFFLCFISPNTLVFLMGLALFSPDEAVLRSKVLSKYYARKASRWLKKFIRSAKRAQILGFKGPAVLPGDYLHRLPLATTLSIMKQHELSGFLYSKTWPLSPAPSDESQRTVPAVDSWSSRWCEIWHVPGLLKVTMSKNPESLNSKSQESFVPFSLEDTEAAYIGKSLIERRRKNSTLTESADRSSIGSLADAEELQTPSRQRSSSFSQRRTKTLFMFEVVHKDIKNLPPRLYSGEDGLEYSCAGWVFGCSSQKEAVEWVKAINSTSKLISIATKEEDDLDSPLPELHITTKVDEATGKIVSTDMTQKIGVDEIKSGRDQKISVIVKRFLLKWIGMIPDDLELAHRYFCRQQYLVDPGSNIDPNVEQSEWIDQLIPTMNKFVPSSANLIEGEQRTIVDTSKRSRIDSIQSVGPILAAADTDIIGTLLVKVMSARGLPVKELSVSALPVSAGPFTLILPKVMVQISIVPSSISSLVYKSGAQPRGPAPVFREDFLFRDLNITRAYRDAAKIIVFVLLRTPLSIGNETTTVIASAEVSLKAFLSEAVPELTLPPEEGSGKSLKTQPHPSSHHHEKQDWFLLFDPQRNLALPNNAGIQLKIKYLGGSC